MAVAGANRPRFWIIAGPNGSGKSTAYGQGDVLGLDGSVWIINPDLLTARLRDVEGLSQEQANLAAIERIEQWLERSILVHQTVGVETVLSTPKYRRLVELAQSHGYEICFAYVVVDTLKKQLERIATRVSKGGHDVPPDKVEARRTRSLEQMPWFFAAADRAWIFDNTGEQPKLVARKIKAASNGKSSRNVLELEFASTDIPQGTSLSIARALLGMDAESMASKFNRPHKKS